ncbi:hypothetical protein GH714_027271 [Hevea brasiliensis]|uniref:Cationic amino acid transporter C-terminal domain-containing protein n=1 Tax=Hevea brasiliensis TaxID=3981 RepID=A0A6A6MQS5_HEVBR|nr:hypothetical protein GH714_027271 [Hevea brasiliensis]
MQTPPKSPNIMPEELPITTATTTTKLPKKLTLVPLVFLIYFEVAGGPYGEEPAVQAAGPLYALLGFLIFPFIWSIPEALITAELSTAYPGNGGFVIWADRAFGPFFGSLMGSWKFLSGVINIAAFPVLCIDYMKKVLPVLDSGWPRKIAILISTLILSFVNYTGLTIVGYVAVVLGQKGVKKDWTLFFNTLFWNLNFWDSVSTLAGEVDKPQKTFPVALFVAVIFTCVSYLIPLFAVTGAVSVNQNEWESGFHATAAEIIAGKWLKYWIEVGAVLSAVGLFEAQLSSCVYQLLGMADLGFLPTFFAKRSKWFNTPWVGILLSTLITIGVSYMNFADIISSANFLYSLGMLLEFASFIWLRKKLPELKRPYKIPMRLPGLVIMCLIPSGFLVLIMVIATKIVYLVSGLMTVGAIGCTLAGEVDKPQKIFPLALFVAVIFTCLSYFIPLFAVIGAVSVNQSEWESGFHATAAEMIAGRWLKYWIEVGATLSAIGLFEAQLSSTAFQLLGMADLGFLPNFFAKRSKWFNTPWVGILLSTLIILGEIARIEETLQDSNEAARIGDNVLNTICVLSAHNGNCYKDCLFVAGGPYGEEPAVQAAGPLYALLGFLIFPFIWSIPEALITAELSTAYPGNGGFVIWADRAFGPFFGSLMGSWKFLSGVINIAAFPVLCIDYMKKVLPVLDSDSSHRWLSLGQKGVKKDWTLFFNTLFWNLNFWDSVSTLAGEVDKPQKTFPVALFVAVIFTCVSYLIPLFAVTGAVSVNQNEWESGFHATAAEIIAGKWLKYWIEVGAVLSAVGLFEAQLSSCVYQLLGMADLGFLPTFFAKRSKWFNTPWVGILLSTLITIGVSYMNFADIISSANFLYSLGMLLEFASFIWLRKKLPELKRPYKIPMRLPGLVIMCLIPSGFLVLIMVIATKIVYLVSGLMTVGAIGCEWESGFHATAAEMIAGRWLKYWIEVGATLSAIGLFEAQLSSTAFQLLGMADLGFLPNFFAKRNVIRICIFSLVEKEIARIEETLQDSNEAARIGDNVLNTICVLSAHNGNCYKDCLFGEWLDDWEPLDGISL